MRQFVQLAPLVVLLLVMPLALQQKLVTADSAVDEDFEDGQVEEVEEEEAEKVEAAISEPEPVYESPQFEPEKFHFIDHFDNKAESEKRWIKSKAKKDDIAEEIAKYDGVWSFEAPQRIVWGDDLGLVLKSKAKHAAIAAPLRKLFTFKEDKPLVVQYEVTLQEGQDCGGSYIKLLSTGKQTEDLTKFNDKTPYTIMFGPDKCGNDYKLHFIFRHVNPINGSITEKHCQKPKNRLEEPFKDKLPHLYTLVLQPDNTFQILVDHVVFHSGDLLKDFQPPVNPPREIDDPNDKKPEDWDEREKIPDPSATKPDDWDESQPKEIPDETAVKPEGWLDDEPEVIKDVNALKPADWDNEIDGEWEPPLIENPICEKAPGCGEWKKPLVANKLYKGKWRAPMIDNPNYRGKWLPRKIENPDFFEDLTPFRMTPIGAIGIELWSMSSDILFDNLLITDDPDEALQFAAKTYDLKRKYIDKKSASFVDKVVNYFKENTWAWRLGIVLVGTILSFTIYRTLRRDAKKEAEKQAKAKKTDEQQEDDEEAEAAAAESENVEPKVTKPKSKSDLEVKPDDAEATEKHSTDEAEDEQQTKTEDAAAAINAKPTGARKRPVRKDDS